LKYREEQNDENFIIQSEQSIHEYKDRINTLEIEIRNKEISTVEMKQQIEDFKKKIFKSHGYIDDQSQTLEEHIKELTIQKSNIKESLEIDKKITNLKLKLKFIMQRKVEKTMEFFCSNQNLFIKYYDALLKMQTSKFNIYYLFHF
jgi:chromosome segregation ATPase